MEVHDDLVAVAVPLGIYATMEAYCSALQEAGRDQHPTELKHFGVKFDPMQPFVRSMATARIRELALHLTRHSVVANLINSGKFEGLGDKAALHDGGFLNGQVSRKRKRNRGRGSILTRRGSVSVPNVW